ncbi:MAG: TIGR03986 family CRISPR-associated RAMP protein, partial [Myxococcota bacterium]|nr:TIGR03986 family CRISPR-associated RAMP protein [Myxococcota bacterium]
MRENGQLRAIGLAMMFRLAYRHSIGKVLHCHQSDSASRKIDMAEAIFGRVLEPEENRDKSGRNGDSLRGRVSFGLARARGKPTPIPTIVTAVLAAPRASYFPSYLEQGVASPTERVADYWTLMDDEQGPKCRLRGWKRYRPHDLTDNPPPRGAADDLSSKFAPLPAKTVFTGRIRIHNLRPVELGALLWALDFGGDSEAQHMLGMARPLGYGQVVIRVPGLADLRSSGGESPDREGLKRQFCEYMGDQCNRKSVVWSQSPQIRELLACACPVHDLEEVKYMALADFAEAKKAKLALAPASGVAFGGKKQRRPQGQRAGSGRTAQMAP